MIDVCNKYIILQQYELNHTFHRTTLDKQTDGKKRNEMKRPNVFYVRFFFVVFLLFRLYVQTIAAFVYCNSSSRCRCHRRFHIYDSIIVRCLYDKTPEWVACVCCTHNSYIPYALRSAQCIPA